MTSLNDILRLQRVLVSIHLHIDSDLGHHLRDERMSYSYERLVFQSFNTCLCLFKFQLLFNDLNIDFFATNNFTIENGACFTSTYMG